MKYTIRECGPRNELAVFFGNEIVPVQGYGINRIRKRLKMTHAQFGAACGVAEGQSQKWAQDLNRPSRPSMMLMAIMLSDHEEREGRPGRVKAWMNNHLQCVTHYDSVKAEIVANWDELTGKENTKC